MTSWLIIIALTISSSVDNLGVGLSYGIRNIRISVYSNLLISVICFLFSAGGIYFGLWISKILPGILPVVLGAIILTIIGIRIMLLAAPRKNQNKNPMETDFKKMNYIGFGESVVLGIALSANALTNGLGAGLLGFPPLLISLLAAFGSFVTIWFGVAFGIKLADVRMGKFTVGQFGTFISGALLLMVAFLAFF